MVVVTGCAALLGGAATVAAQDQIVADLERVDNPNVCLPAAGSRGWCGDGGLAGQARLAGPRDIAPLADGGYLIADTLNHVVRRVDAEGIITTVAGVAAGGLTGDGGPASEARLDSPAGVAPADDGFVVADPAAHVVRRVSADGTIQRLAGTGREGTSADGGSATRAALRAPRSVTVLDDGSVLIADADDHRVRRVAPDGTITTFAGTGAAGTSGDGGLATAAALQEPTYVAREPAGSVLIVDRGAGRVRRVVTDGTISTVAGGEIPGTPATRLRLDFPSGVTSTQDGGFLITEEALVRQVFADGATRVTAGTGTPGFNGNRSIALQTQLTLPTAVAWVGDGAALVADASNDRIRRFNLLGGIRTIAGFDRPDQVLGVPTPAATEASAASRLVARAARARCSERSQAGRYNVLRIRPSDGDFRGRGTVTLFVESSSAASVRVSVRGSGAREKRLSVGPRRPVSVRLRPLRRRGRYRIRLVGTLLQRPRTTRCAERGLRVP